MENKELLLSEEKYQKTKKKISLVALFILIVGVSFGGFLIYNGVKGSSPEKLSELTSKLEKRKDQYL